MSGHHAENIVALGGMLHSLAIHKDNEEGTQKEEEGYDEELCDTAYEHVLLALSAVAAGEVALHHILVEARGGDNHEHAGKELLPEVCALLGIIEVEHTRGGVVGYGRCHFAEGEAQIGTYEVYAEYHRHYEAEALEGVGPYKGFDAALHGVEPYQGYGDNDIEHEGYVQGREHKVLQHGADNKEAHCGTKHFRHEEEPRSGLVGGAAEAFFKVAVDRYEVALVEHRHQHKGYHGISDNEAEHHLQV